jgi:hypothetical protein
MSGRATLRARWSKVSLPNKLTVGCTSTIMVATIWYAFSAHHQWTTMASQLSQMKETSTQTNRLICATQQLANAAKSQAESSSAEAGAMRSLADAAQKQSKALSGQVALLRAQVVGTFGIALATGFYVVPEALRVQIFRPDGLPMPDTRVRARDIDISLTVTIKNVFDGAIIDGPSPFKHHWQTMPARQAIDWDIRLPHFDPEMYQAIQDRLERFLVIEGKFDYDNGFGDHFPTDICVGYFGYEDKRFTIGRQPVPCEYLSAELPEAIKKKQEHEAQAAAEQKR